MLISKYTRSWGSRKGGQINNVSLCASEVKKISPRTAKRIHGDRNVKMIIPAISHFCAGLAKNFVLSAVTRSLVNTGLV